MSSIPKDPRKKFVTYFSYVTRWLDGKSPKQIATDLKFPSPAAMYQRLQEDGFKVCEKCGETPVKADHSEKHKRRRRAKQTGKAVELSPASDVADLLRPVVDRLASAIDELDTSVETYRAGRFEQADIYQHPVHFYRSCFAEEKWREICEKFGENPKQESFVARGVKTVNAGGATQSPRETALIAAYVIVGGPIEPLLEALHPDPPGPHETKLLSGTKPKVPQLKLLAKQVARLLRVHCGFDG